MIVDVLNVANDNDFKMVLATRPPERSSDVSDDMVENDLDVSSEDASVSNTEGVADAGASE